MTSQEPPATPGPDRSTPISTAAPEQRPSTEADPVGAYAWDVVRGAIPACRLARLACERHFRDLRDGWQRGLSFSPAHARYGIRFFPFLRHSKGEWGGQPVELAAWQQFVVGSVWGWLRPDGTRRFRVVYEEIPRKNGKSTKLAGIGIVGLLADGEPGAEIYAAATKKDQARIIFGEARRMVRASAELSARIGVFKLNLSVDATDSKFEPLSSDERTLDGLNPHFVLVDELHKHKNRALLDVLDTALGARRQPLLWIITTAGDDDPESVYAQENAYAQKVLEGVVDDDSWFVFITTIDKGDRWDDPVAWAKANPNLGISVKLEDLERMARKAAKSPSAKAAFLRLRLNVRSSSATRYVDMDVWARNGLGRFDPAEMRGRKCYAGLDLSSKIDLSGFIKLFPPAAEGDRWRVVCRFWMPADTVEEKAERDQVQYRRWIEDGWIEPTAGNIVDHNEIQQAIIGDHREHEILSLAYDPWNATQLAVALQAEGVPVVEFIQGIRSYTAPTKELEAVLLAEKLDHGNNPVLTWMAANLVVVTDKNDNRMPTKKRSQGRIDGMSALIMAIGRSMGEDAAPYGDGRDLLVL
jgi:phage terminase large subunit-like protein